MSMNYNCIISESFPYSNKFSPLAPKQRTWEKFSKELLSWLNRFWICSSLKASPMLIWFQRRRISFRCRFSDLHRKAAMKMDGVFRLLRVKSDRDWIFRVLDKCLGRGGSRKLESWQLGPFSGRLKYSEFDIFWRLCAEDWLRLGICGEFRWRTAPGNACQQQRRTKAHRHAFQSQLIPIVSLFLGLLHWLKTHTRHTL